MDSPTPHEAANRHHQLQFQEEWYEDSLDLNLKAYRLREDEWLELQDNNQKQRDSSDS